MTATEFKIEARSARAALLETWGKVPEDWRGLPPAPERWSPIQILDHVSRVQTSVEILLRKLLSRVDPEAVGGASSDLGELVSMGRFQLRNREFKATAPESAVPSDDPELGEILDSLENGTRALERLADQFWPLNLSSVTHRHSVLGTLNAYQWFRFVPLHELRHLDQMVEVLQGLQASHRKLKRLPGVGKSIATDLMILGFRDPSQLRGADPQLLFERLRDHAGGSMDRCVLYVFRCAIYAADTREPDPDRLLWWNWKD